MKSSDLLREKMRIDRSAISGAILMVLFAVLAGWRCLQTERLFFALLAFKNILWCVFLLKRKSAKLTASRGQSLLAYVSALLPLFYLSEVASVETWRSIAADSLAVLGFLLATLAVIELGSNVGVSPAARESRIRTGVYRYLKHPMYFGYMISEFGLVLLRPENIVLFTISCVLYVTRTKIENRVLMQSGF